MNDGRGMNARGIDGCLIEDFNCARKGQVWIGDPQRRRCDRREVLGHQYGRRLGSFRQRRVLWVGDESHLLRARFFNARNAYYFDGFGRRILRAAFQTRVQSACQFCQLHALIVSKAKKIILRRPAQSDVVWPQPQAFPAFEAGQNRSGPSPCGSCPGPVSSRSGRLHRSAYRPWELPPG